MLNKIIADPCPFIETLLDENGGDVDEVIRVLTAKPCSWKSARQLADAFAHCLGLTPAELIKRWRKIR